MSQIEVEYEVFSSAWHISQALKELSTYTHLGFDTETRGVYAKTERKQAIKLIESGDLDIYNLKLASVVANNSGLSFPSLTEVTHFVFGLNRSQSIILVIDTPIKEMMVWKWMASAKSCFFIHNALFDLKIMYHRVRSLPEFFDDTALMAKTLVNNSDSWKAKVGLKDLMGPYYDPAWTLIDEYEPSNLRDPKFLKYASIDGASVYYLWELIQEEISNVD